MVETTVAIVAFNNISPFLLSIPCTVFGESSRYIDGAGFKVMVCTAGKRILKSSAGFGISTCYSLRELDFADIVVVPSWRPDEVPPAALLKGLRSAHRRGATIVGLCLGAYVLAAAGLLDSRPATTHWGWCADLAQRYPLIDIRPDVLYVDDGDVITSAGVAAGIDCCLHLVRRLRGVEVAARVAKLMVVPPHRQGGQAQFVEMPVSSGQTNDRFSRHLEWVQQHLDQPHTLDSLAEHFVMSRRTFTRHFRTRTGTTVGAWLLHQRLSLAQRLLETTSKSIELIARETGFVSDVLLRFHFKKTLNTTPSRYRMEFGSKNNQEKHGRAIDDIELC